MRKKNKGKIYYSMQAISLVPLLLYGVLIILFSTQAFSYGINKEVCDGLESSSRLCQSLIDTTYPGDYQLVETQSGSYVAYSLYKGDTDITTHHEILDQIKASTDMDVTLFYQDTRILTTITNWNRQRIIGTAAPQIVIQDVLEKNQARFYDNVFINNTTYFAYYTPLTNSDGSVVGMLFIGKPTKTVKSMIDSTVCPIVFVGIFALIIASIINYTYAKNFVTILNKLKKFVNKISTGNLTAELDPSVTARGDELSEIGQATIHMQTSLRKLIELDALTELYNRRSGSQKLQNTHSYCTSRAIPYSLVIADIDYFKQINDTYGHQNGDLVLQNTAKILKEHTHKKGYAIRWGGEEFLLVYENCPLEQALDYLKQLQVKIQDSPISIDGKEICPTMTFGVACDISLDTNQLLLQADQKLYEGKKNGRNCIIS